MDERERGRNSKEATCVKKNNIDSQGSALPWKHSSSIQRVVKGSEAMTYAHTHTRTCTHTLYSQTQRITCHFTHTLLFIIYNTVYNIAVSVNEWTVTGELIHSALLVCGSPLTQSDSNTAFQPKHATGAQLMMFFFNN